MYTHTLVVADQVLCLCQNSCKFNEDFYCKALYVLFHFCLMIEKIVKIVLHEIKDDCGHNKSIFKYSRLSTPTRFILTL